MKLTSEQIQKLKDYFSKQADVELVYLYGSFAEDRVHSRSDIDFGVLFKAPLKSYRRLSEIMRGLSDFKLPAEPDVRDIDFNNTPSYLFNVTRGILIYAQNEIVRISFEVEAARKFYDNHQLRELKYDYMKKSFKEGTYGYRLYHAE